MSYQELKFSCCCILDAFQSCQTISRSSHQRRSSCDHVNGNALHQLFETSFSGEVLHELRPLQHFQNMQCDAAREVHSASGENLQRQIGCFAGQNRNQEFDCGLAECA